MRSNLELLIFLQSGITPTAWTWRNPKCSNLSGSNGAAHLAKVNPKSLRGLTKENLLWIWQNLKSSLKGSLRRQTSIARHVQSRFLPSQTSKATSYVTSMAQKTTFTARNAKSSSWPEACWRYTRPASARKIQSKNSLNSPLPNLSEMALRQQKSNQETIPKV